MKVGERGLTSGLDGIFPAAFLIGTVERAVKGSGVYSHIAVRPATDFSDIHVVLVILAAAGQGLRAGREAGSGPSHGRRGADASDGAGALSRWRAGGCSTWWWSVDLRGAVRGPAAGMWTGTLGGLMQDALSGSVVGLGGFAKTVIGTARACSAPSSSSPGRSPGRARSPSPRWCTGSLSWGCWRWWIGTGRGFSCGRYAHGDGTQHAWPGS